MDLALNIITKPIKQPTEKKIVKTKISVGPKIRNSTDNLIRFDTGQHKVKAFVARRRPLTKISGITNSTNNKTISKPKEILSKKTIQNVINLQTDNLKSSKEVKNTTKSIVTDLKKSSTAKAIDDGLILNVISVPKTPKPTPIADNYKFQGPESDEYFVPKKLPEKSVADTNIQNAKPKTSIEKISTKSKTIKRHDKDLFDNPFGKTSTAPVLGQRLVKPIVERIFNGTKVETLNIHSHLKKTLLDLLNITELTTVQQKTIPQALEGKDLLVRSQTGSGKTLAYALPIVEILQQVRPKLTRDTGVLAVIIVPTRELAIQTYELFQKLLKPYTWIVPGVLMGGERRKVEKARLRKGINILVGTPGRLVDHLLHTESFKLYKSKFLVLDEADRLMEMGYEKDVKQIVDGIETQRTKHLENSSEELPNMQRLLLSATLTSVVQKLAGLTLKDPLFIDNSDEDPSKAMLNTNGYSKDTIASIDFENDETIDDIGILTIPADLKLSYVVVPPKLRLVTLAGLLAKEFKGKKKFKAMVFMSTTEMVGYHYDLLTETLTQKILDEDDETAEDNENETENEALLKGLRFFKLYGSMSQTDRQGVFKGFCSCNNGILIATDVAGRGLDVPEVDMVIQYSPPQKISDFVHRAGRTARAGRCGRAVLFLAPNETQFVRYLEDKRLRISQSDMDDYLKPIFDADNVANTLQEAVANLQHKFQDLIEEDKEMHEKACKAFVTWTKFYSSFPKDLKRIFNVKSAHMGHFAKSFGLSDAPTSFSRKHSIPKPPPPTNRLTYTERDPEKIKMDKKAASKRRFTTTVTSKVRNTNAPPSTGKLMKILQNSKALNISEFGSGFVTNSKIKKSKK